MIQENNKKIVKVIQTTKGEIYSPYSNPNHSIQLMVFNQIFTPEPVKNKSNLLFDLQHLNYHKKNPNSLQNTSLGWASIQHQIRQTLATANLNEQNLLIFESSSYNKKIPEIFSRFKIVKGFNYRINLESFDNISQDKVALMNEQHVLKQVQMEFSLGNGTFKPGYIGEINFSEIQNPIFQGIIKAYLNYSCRTQCPIVIDFLSQGQEPYQLFFREDAEIAQQNFERKFKILLQFLQKSKEAKSSKNLIIYNLPILLVYQKTTFRISNIFSKQIDDLFSQYEITLGFKLLRYSKYNQKHGIDEIIKLIHRYPDRIILSSGIKYKTDLSLNSGQGFSLYNYKTKLQSKQILNMNSIEYIRHFISQENLQQILNLNILRMFDWKEKKEELKIQMFWKCDCCSNNFSESIKAFGKFGKQFCSIKCLKAFNF